ncbi:NAD(P)-binding domain-containing protein [Helicobacter sp. MIT 21-1697]|uniref:NAD(P)-binding domain-containing protein n=1 Tax=Helicobacter sp. MIT 21-1697 TaxID=2993733 RepID=UPI00224A8A12|nr:NAD(P)-binding domain-containing protein [Helicobacter sp. MIT 21-1697]MCX2717048.1 NAD(P)-binding domain-containing protein [Helicobacter sp. MIT 21-1697]
MSKIYDVAVVGCGPAGISAAIESQAHNLSVIALEKGDSHNMSIRKFYKEGKRVDKDYKGQVVQLEGKIDFKDGNRESTLAFFDEILSPIEVNYQSDVESVTSSSDNGNEGFILTTTDNRSYKARFVIICIGKMGQPNKPSYALPPTIRKCINFNANDAQQNEKILVVGGGNSAVEYACDLAQNAANGGSVTLNYRRSEFTRINDINATQLQALTQGGKILTKLGIDITELSDNNGKVGVHFSDGSKESFDRVIYAIGGASPIDFLKKCSIAADEKGVPLCSPLWESSVKNIFVAGDIALKNGGSIAAAIKYGYDIVQEIAQRVKH